MQKLSSLAIAWRQWGQVVRVEGAPWGCDGGNGSDGPRPLGLGRGGGAAADNAVMNSAAVPYRLSSRAYERRKTSSSHLGTLGLTSLGKSVPAGRSPVK